MENVTTSYYYHLDCCSPVWDGFSNQLSDKLQKLQNRAARVIVKANYETSSNLLLEILEWDSLSVLAPVYLQDLFNTRSTNYNLRTNYLKRSFSYSGAQLWNSLPQDVRNIKSIGQLRREINRLFQSSVSHSATL